MKQIVYPGLTGEVVGNTSYSKEAAGAFMDEGIFEVLPGLLLVLARDPIRVMAANRAFRRLSTAPSATDSGVACYFDSPGMDSLIADMMDTLDNGVVPPHKAVTLACKNNLQFEVYLSLIKRSGPYYLAAAHFLETLGAAGGIFMAQAVYRNFSQPVICKDPQGRFIGANLAFANHLGKPMDAILGKTGAEVIDIDLTPRLIQADEDARQSGKSVVIDETSFIKGGERFEVVKTPIFDSRGTYRGIMAVGHNIERHARLVEAAKERNKLLEAINDATQTLLAGQNNFEQNTWKALERIGRAAGADRVYVWKNIRDDKNELCAERLGEWQRGASRSPLPALERRLCYKEHLPGVEKRFSHGDNLAGPVRGLPVELHEVLSSRGALSLALSPIYYNSRFWGFIGFDDCKHEREWTGDEEILLRAGGALIGAALAQASFNEVLQYSESRFRDVAMAAGEVIWELDQDGRILYVSERSSAVFGMEPSKLVGRLAPESGRIPEYVWLAERAPESPGGEIGDGKRRYFHNLEHSFVDGAGRTRYLQSSGVMKTTAEGEYAGMRGVSIDVTDEKKSKEQLAEAVEAIRFANEELSQYAANTQFLAVQAEAANRAKSEFLANIGHEVRTPINVITGMAYLAMQTNLTLKQEEYIRKIKDSGSALLTILNNIIDYAKLEGEGLVLEDMPLRISEIFTNMFNALQPQCMLKGLKCTCEVDPAIPEILKGDPGRIGQILKILTHNAFKFTSRGGISMRCDLDVDMHDRVRLCCEVKDSGIGMTAAEQRRIFTPFSQGDSSTARKFGGAGVGLSLARKLVEAMGGEVSVSSKPEGGTVIVFYIELMKPEEMITPLPAVGPEIRGQTAGSFENIAGAYVLAFMDADVTNRPFLDIFSDLKLHVTIVNGLSEVTSFIAAMSADSSNYDAVVISMGENNKEEAKTMARAARENPGFDGIPLIGLGPWTIKADKEMQLLLDDILPPGVPIGAFRGAVAQWVYAGMQTRLKQAEQKKMEAVSETAGEWADKALGGDVTGGSLVALLSLERLLDEDDGEALRFAESLAPMLLGIDRRHGQALLEAVKVFDFASALAHEKALWQILARMGYERPEAEG